MELDENSKNSQSSLEIEVVQDDSDVEEACHPSPTNSETSTMPSTKGGESEKIQLTTKRKNKTLSLIVSNLPIQFNYTQIKNYLEDTCGPCDVRMLKDGTTSRTAKAVFKTESQLARAKDVLNSNSIDDFNIVAYESDSDLTVDDGPQAKRKKDAEDTSWGLDFDVWRSDPRGLYGVKPQYLSTMGINDALQNWVLVINFRCGREELKEVMELAGDVLVCSVMSRKACPYANVMYRHPLEALQSVSMLNGQMFYGRPLTVKLLKGNIATLPKGLNNVGPGLGKYGKPLRDVVRHYVRFIKGAENNININIFRTPLEQATDKDDPIPETDDTRKRAKDAIENLIAEGVDLKDFVYALKSIIEAQKEDSLDELIEELANAVDIDTKELDASPSSDKELGANLDLPNKNTEDKNCHGKSTPESPKSVRKAIEASKDSVQRSSSSSSVRSEAKSVTGRTPTPSTSSPSTPTIRCRPINQIRLSAPKPSYQSGGPRNMGPTGPSRPVGMGGSSFGSSGPRNVGPNNGPRFGPSGMTSAPFRPMIGPNSQGRMCGPMSGPVSRPSGPAWAMSGPSGPMSGPNGPMSSANGAMGPSGPMCGPIGPMCGPNGPMSGPNGPMPGPCGPMSGPNGPMAGQGGPMSGQGGPTSGQGGPIGPMSGQGGPIGPMSGQVGPIGPMSGQGGPMSGPGGPMSIGSSSSEATLQFSNLPFNTTFALLSEKLSKVGQLLSIQFTLPGCVVVKYASRAHAERCLQLFNQTRLEGNLITVSFAGTEGGWAN